MRFLHFDKVTNAKFRDFIAAIIFEQLLGALLLEMILRPSWWVFLLTLLLIGASWFYIVGC